MPKHRQYGECFLLSAIVVCALLLFGLTQGPITVNDSYPHDSGVYFSMAEQAASGEPISELRPFAYRVALPFLVGTIFPDDLTFGFKLLNLLFASLAAVVFHLYLRSFGLRPGTALLLLLCFIFAPQSPFRFAHFLPVYVDPPALFFIVLLLYLTQKIKRLNLRLSLAVTALAVVGTLFREIVVCGALVFFFGQCLRLRSRAPFLEVKSWRELGLSLLPPAASAGAALLIHLLVEGTGGYSYLSQMAGVIAALARQPDIYVLAWLVSFGVIPLILLLASCGIMSSFLRENQAVAAYLFVCVLLSLFAGFHTDRIVFWSFPTVLLLFGLFLERHPITKAAVLPRLFFFIPLILAQILAWRIWLQIPGDPRAEVLDPGPPPILLLSAYGDATLGHMYASTLPTASRLALLGQYIVLALYFGIVLRLAGGR